MLRKYDDIAKLDEVKQAEIFDMVTIIIQREKEIEPRFDSRGKVRVGAIETAYQKFYMKGKARTEDYSPKVGGQEVQAEPEDPDVGVEERTDPADISKILKELEEGGE